VLISAFNGGGLFGLKGPSDDKNGTGTEGKADIEEKTSDQIPEDDEHILCVQCLNRITQPSQRIEVNGAHRHSFANPHGLVYDIGCFRSARGCECVGQMTAEFTWFTGYRWRVSVCGVCLIHLGWCFNASADHGFYGLILNRLIFPKGE
jgi:hypothetical protein